ncbi:MAG: right-handed parallel beta-helix repeat-containing protein [Phycisphaerales bacterium]|nr:MAG: right-handed parallel beta-helix repeat-containing protein [Phycisphaerales bacterium]
MHASKTITFLVVAASGVLLTGLATQGQTVWYVDDDAPAGGDGSTWATAYDDLQDALGAAAGGGEIRVATGTYRPDGGSGDRVATFQLISGVAIHGGYAGYGAPDPDERDVVVYETILTGDLDGNDGPDFANYDENSYHVVTGSGVDSTAVLDGFTIRAGYADGAAEDAKGGGIYNVGGSPTIANCTITCNSAEHNAGGMTSRLGAHPTLTNCAFRNNAGVNGPGGMVIYQGDPTLTNCVFSENTSGGHSGGLSIADSGAVLTGCAFDANEADGDGGGASIWLGATPTLTDCMFTGNLGANGGGLRINAASPTLRNCTFTCNTSTGRAAGLYIDNSSSPTVIDGKFISNAAGGGGGGVYVHDSSPTLVNCSFLGNTTMWGGGGVDHDNSAAILSNCLFSGNQADRDGGGLRNKVDGHVALVNCTFSGNTAMGHPVGGSGGGVYNWDSTARVANCIFWGNQDLGGTDESAQIHNTTGGTVSVSYSCVQEWSSGGMGNINDDPLMIDANGPDGTPGTEDDDLRLAGGSPCIDAANNSSVPADTEDLDDDGDILEPVPFDLGWAARFVDDPDTTDTGSGTPPIVDMGAYEFQVAPVVIAADIKPGSCPNLFNRNSHGMLPAALVGTSNFDATTIDIATVRLSRADGIGGGVAAFEGPPGPHSVFEDVATPFEGEPCECHDLGSDGVIDLSVNFKADNVVEVLELEALPPGVLVELVVSGNLLDGYPFTASDCIRLVPPGAPPGLVEVSSTVPDVWIDAYPLDLQLDDGGFADFERSYPQSTMVTYTASRTADGVRFAYWEIDGEPQVRGQTTIDFEVAGEVMEATAVYRNPGFEGIQGTPVEPIEVQPIGGPMQPANR